MLAITCVCMICDGYEIANKKCGLFVNTEANIATAFVLNWFTPYITVFTQGLCEVGPQMRQKLQDHGYPLVETPIRRFVGHDHEMTGVELVDGSQVALETGLVAMGFSSLHRLSSGFRPGVEGKLAGSGRDVSDVPSPDFRVGGRQSRD